MNPTTDIFSGITLVGLGPGSPDLLTRQAWNVLQSSAEVYTPTPDHPGLTGLPASVQIFPLSPDQVVSQTLALGRRPQGVVLALPGNPLAEAFGQEVQRQAQAEGVPLRCVAGLGMLDAVFNALGLSPLPNTAVMDARELSTVHIPPFSPSAPALILHIEEPDLVASVQTALRSLYPAGHEVRLVQGAGTDQEQSTGLLLSELGQQPLDGRAAALYVPPLHPMASFEAFQEIIAHLRAPDGCPWDREQTHLSLRPSLLEETYEVLQALDLENTDALREELGDLLLNILLQAQIAAEAGEFTMADVLEAIHAKIVYRHPHVFGSVDVKNTEGVLVNWERLKEKERAAAGKQEASLLSGIAPALPALVQAEQIQKRAARVGFDWPEISGVWDKFYEELQEIKDAPTSEEREKEVGDLLFAAVNLARWFKVDAESVLRATNNRFRQRFSYIEEQARKQGRSVTDLNLDEMEALWQAAKKL